MANNHSYCRMLLKLLMYHIKIDTDPNIQLTVNCSSDPVQIYWSSGNDLSVEWILLQYSCDGAQVRMTELKNIDNDS